MIMRLRPHLNRRVKTIWKQRKQSRESGEIRGNGGDRAEIGRRNGEWVAELMEDSGLLKKAGVIVAGVLIGASGGEEAGQETWTEDVALPTGVLCANELGIGRDEILGL